MTADVVHLRSGLAVREAHPVAELFPMLDDDDLNALADDIAERGQLHPIVLDQQGRILDGRNRYAACGLAEVEPEFTTYDGDDPDGYALAVNIARRHLSKGQQAVVAARACLVSKQTQRSAAKHLGLNAGRIGQATTVLDHGPELADLVLAGSMGLDEAYKEAQGRKSAAATAERLVTQLRDEAPDLAALVAEESVTAREAFAIHQKRQSDRADRRRAATANFDRVCMLGGPPPQAANTHRAHAAAWAAEIDRDDTALDRLDAVIGYLSLLREELAQ